MSFVDDWFSVRRPDTRTLLLLGPIGTGKSSTGNAILGQTKFLTSSGFDNATKSCEVHTKEVNGLTVNVIDTPGMDNLHIGIEKLAEEFGNGLSIVKYGISAVLLVISIEYRSGGELRAVTTLERIFGPKMYDYFVVVFTNGDKLAENETLDGKICTQEPLMELLQKCGFRKVLFDNMSRRGEQLEKLLALVEQVVCTTVGRPFVEQVNAYLKNSGHSTVKDAAYAVLKELVECQTDEHPSLDLHESREATYAYDAANETKSADVAANEERSGSPSQEIHSDYLGMEIADAAVNKRERSGSPSEEINSDYLVGGKTDQPDIAALEITSDKLTCGVQSGSGGELTLSEQGMKKKMRISGLKRNLNEAANNGLADLLSKSFTIG